MNHEYFDISLTSTILRMPHNNDMQQGRYRIGRGSLRGDTSEEDSLVPFTSKVAVEAGRVAEAIGFTLRLIYQAAASRQDWQDAVSMFCSER